MKRFIITISLLIFSISLFADIFATTDEYWKRDDGSVYQFIDDTVILKFVGYKLQKGSFKKNDVKIKDIYEKNEIFYGFRRSNDQFGNLKKWEKVKLIMINENHIQIKNRFGELIVSLEKITQNDFLTLKNAPNYIIGLWKRDNDGSIYKFEKEIAILNRVGYNLEKGKFKENQIKLKNIEMKSFGNFSAMDRINKENGNISKWCEVTINLTNNELTIISDTNNKIQHYTKINETNSQETNKIIAELSKKIDQIEISKKDNSNTQIDDSNIQKKNIYIRSDLDVNIPHSRKLKKYGVAVIIGNANYQNNNIPNVDFALNDALILKKYLIKILGYQEEDIIFEENATKAKFETIFGVKDNYKGKLYNWIKPNQTDVFIYYVGHGAPDIKNNKAFFVPVDSDPSTISLNGYSIDTFYENLSKLPYKTLTVVIDACFSGTSQKGLLVKNISPAGIEVDNPIMELPNSSFFLSSSGKEYSSWYEKQGHSLFTYYFLKGLKGVADSNNDKKLTVGELKNYINEEVPYKARRLNNIEQTPQIYGNDNKVIAEY